MKTTSDDGAGLAPMDCSLRFRVIAYDPQTKREEDCGIVEGKSWEDAWRTVQARYNYPKRMIPIPEGVIDFPNQL